MLKKIYLVKWVVKYFLFPCIHLALNIVDCSSKFSKFLFMSKILTIVLLSYACSCLFFISCRKSCGQDKDEFIASYQKFIAEVKDNKKKRTDKDWSRLDNKFRIYLKECQPRFASQLTNAEAYRFWQQAMGYMYARYGLDLLKKFRNTDDLILKLRDSLYVRQIDIPLAMDSLCSEWPILIGTKGSNLGQRLEKILRREQRDTLLPAWKN